MIKWNALKWVLFDFIFGTLFVKYLNAQSTKHKVENRKEKSILVSSQYFVTYLTMVYTQAHRHTYKRTPSHHVQLLTIFPVFFYPICIRVPFASLFSEVFEIIHEHMTLFTHLIYFFFFLVFFFYSEQNK